MDAGIATEENLAALRERDFHWITVKRGGVKPDQVEAVNAQEPDATFETKSVHEVRAWRLSHENEAQLCIWSQARQEKDEAILAKKRESFESALADLHKGLSKPRCIRKYDKILERFGRLRERYALVNRHYDITVTKAPDGKACAVTWKRNATFDTRDARVGHYVLRTSHTEWSVEDTVRTYWRLTELEATFRSLKSGLGLRPVWHQLSKRIEGHLFIAVLALYGVNVIQTRLAAHGINHKWATLRTKLGRWQRTTIAVTTTDGSRIEVRRDVRPDPTASAIAKAAGTPYMPQKRIRRLGKPQRFPIIFLYAISTTYSEFVDQLFVDISRWNFYSRAKQGKSSNEMSKTSFRKDLSMPGMLRAMRKCFDRVPDPITPRGITLSDCLMVGLAVFSLKIPSLLKLEELGRLNKSSTLANNLKSMFGVKRIPSDSRLRERFDGVDPRSLRSGFKTIFSFLRRGKILEHWTVFEDHYLIAIDGTGSRSSHKVKCKNCCVKNHRNGSTEYFHQMLVATMIHPDHSEVFPFAPEPIRKEDGADKNDCERNAANPGWHLWCQNEGLTNC